jgi:hypothetical protein
MGVICVTVICSAQASGKGGSSVTYMCIKKLKRGNPPWIWLGALQVQCAKMKSEQHLFNFAHGQPTCKELYSHATPDNQYTVQHADTYPVDILPRTIPAMSRLAQFIISGAIEVGYLQRAAHTGHKHENGAVQG